MRDEINGVRTWIELDTKAIQNNIAAFRERISATCKLCAVVKSNAYGHGLVDFSKTVVAMGVDWLAVDSITEALRLRREGITIPIVVLGFTLPEMLGAARDNDISITVSSIFTLEKIAELPAGKQLRIHFKVDTGMGRQGFNVTDIDRVIRFLKDHPENIAIAGLYTHFAAAKNPTVSGETLEQLAVFEKWTAAVVAAGYKPIRHAAATAGTIAFPQAHFDMVRIGIGLYGLWPSLETKIFAENTMKLAPVMSWRTIISEIKEMPKGQKVGYDFTEQLSRDSKIAVCPIGYWHGFPRCLSSVGRVLVRGKVAKVVGRVAMDMIVIDVTDIPDVSILDQVTLLGKDGAAEITAYDMATLAAGSWYEIITRINPLIKKIYR